MMDSDMPAKATQSLDIITSYNHHIPLKIIWSRILVLAIWTEWTDIARLVVDQPMPNHFVLALEPFPALRTGASSDRAIVRSIL